MAKQPNMFELRARVAKTRRLVRLIDDMVALLGLTAKRDGLVIAELVRAWKDAEWTQAGIQIGADHVGVLTRLAVLDHYRKAQEVVA